VIHTLISCWNEWDASLLARFSESRRRRGIDLFMYWVSRSADGHIYPLVGLLMIALDVPHAAAFAGCMTLAFVFELPLYKILKNTVRRDRPFEVIVGVTKRIEPPDRFSFPSGHTAGAFVVAALVASFYPSLILPSYLWASSVGVSRVYNAVHFPSDVLVGMLLGLGSAWLAMAILM